MRVIAGLIAVALSVPACTAQSADDPLPAPPPAASAGPPPASAVPTPGAPALEVAVVVDGLDHVWDVVQSADGTLLVDERGGGFTVILPDGTVRPVEADFEDLFARGETGLMGLVLDPAFEANRRLYSCQGVDDGSIAVVGWTIAADWASATRVADPLVGGLPLNERSGRHGGCRLRFTPDGALLVGTGDTAGGTVAQDPRSLGGKVLRVDPATGEREVWTLGHRNVQGLAVRPGSGQVFAVEHGPARDDEVNLLRPGGNYGWNPDGGDRYDESVPMTDEAVPGAIPAVWSSGEPTLATSGATFLDGEQWGAYDGLLLVGLLKAQGVLALRLDDDGALIEQFRLPELDGAFGRLRSVLQGIDGALYVTTDNGSNEDRLLRVTPR
jgi:glucose/arabinose dehydrogenase